MYQVSRNESVVVALSNESGGSYKLVLGTLDVGDVHVVGGGAKILKLLAGEDVDSDEMDLSVTVLSGLGGGHVNDLAGAALDNDVTVLAQGRALHGERQRGAGVGGVELDIVLQRGGDF